MKSVIYSIVAIALTIGLLFGTLFLFGINIVLGIIGIVVLVVVPGIFWRKAAAAADGFVTTLLVKYIFPIISAVIIIGTIIYIIYCAIMDQPIW